MYYTKIAEETWNYIEHLLMEECGLLPDCGLKTERANCINAIKNAVEARDDFRWLIEAPGQRYLAVQRLSMSDNFEWTTDHNRALTFRSEDHADALMMAVRQMDRQFQNGKLFGFEASLGTAKAVEHAWMDGLERYQQRLGEMLKGAANRINASR